jgi:HPt (histidine-containing phosphotransfer) domain-containing protein
MKNVQPLPDSSPSNAPNSSIAPLVIHGVRVREAIARFAGDEERYKHGLLEFISHGPAATAQIRQAITNGSHETAIKLVCSFKGRTGMLGMVELHAIAQNLEMGLSNGEPMTLWLEKLESAVEEMSREISSVLCDTS